MDVWGKRRVRVEGQEERGEEEHGKILNGAVSIGNNGGTTTLNGTATVTTLNATSASTTMTIGNNITTGAMSIGNSLTGGSINIASGAGFTGNIGIGAGSLDRTGVINIGTGGSGGITIGNSTCNTNLYNVYVDGGALRIPRLITRGSVVKTVPAGSSIQLIGDITGHGTTYDFICIAFNGDNGPQPNMVVSATVSATQLFVTIANAVAGSARLSYAVFVL